MKKDASFIFTHNTRTTGKGSVHRCLSGDPGNDFEWVDNDQSSAAHGEGSQSISVLDWDIFLMSKKLMVSFITNRISRAQTSSEVLPQCQSIVGKRVSHLF